MNIGIVCYPTYGGSGVVATELGLGLANKGHKVHFITYRIPPRMAGFHENVYYHEVNPYDYPLFEFAPYESALASKLVHVVQTEKLDILHVHYAIPHASVAFNTREILRSMGIYIPYITTLHGTDITLVGTDPSFAPVVEFSINQSDGVTAVSNNLKEITMSQFNIENEIRVIYNFVDIERFRKTDKSHFKLAIAPNGEKILTHVSNFRKVKRINDVVDVFNIVQAEIPAKLILIGDGPERLRINAQCQELGILDKVMFLGKQDAIEDMLTISDLFLLCSEKESFGLSALEAMACEVPVISTNAGGLPEVNINGQTGYLSEIGDVQDMAKNAISLLKDEALFKKISKNAYLQANQFRLDKILSQYEAYYQEVIQSGRSKGI